MSRRLILLPLLLATLLLAGCFSLPRENLEIIRYSLRPDSLGGPMDTAYPYDLSILPFEASSVLRGDRIVSMDDERELSTYYYHRWIAPPEELLTDVLTEDLTESGLFQRGIFRQTVGTVPRYEIHGRLVHLYADNRRDQELAVLEVVVSVFRMSPPYFQKDLQLQRSYHYDLPRANRRVDSYMPATADAVTRWLRDVRTDLTTLLADDPGVELNNQPYVPVKGPQRTIQDLQNQVQELQGQLKQGPEKPPVPTTQPTE